MNVVDVIRKETRGREDKIAVIEGAQSVTYRELLAAVDIAAAELEEGGIGAGRRVAFLASDSIDYIVASLAVLSRSAVIVPVSPALAEEEIDTVLERIDVHCLLSERGLSSRKGGRKIFSNGPLRGEFFLSERTARERDAAEIGFLNPAFIRFSSGTTGASKGVLISHQAILQRTDAADRGLAMTEKDVVIWVLSMSFHFVVTILLFLRRAATIVICSGDFPGSLREGLAVHGGSFIYASPFHYHLLARSDDFPPDLLSRVRLAVTTAMRLPAATGLDFRRKFGFELTEAYGIIEVGLPFLNLSGRPEKRGSVGTILPDYRVKIDRPDPEGIGEVHLKGPGMFGAYFSPWQTRSAACPGGWFHTGDLGRLDEDGFLWLVGRGKNVINFAGMKVFPEEVEAVLNRHPAVKESLVSALDHPQYGELPVVHLVLKKGRREDFDPEKLRRFCYRHLAPFKVPKEFHAVPRLPKTVSGKIRRW